jgi:diadenosine tetraphosphate (Ap4A) HIT family hydrolase
MHHYRKNRQSYARLHKGDQRRGGCSFCTDDSLSGRVIRSTETMQLLPNRTYYDMFEGLHVLDHLMIIPKRHVETIDDFSREEKLEMMDLIGEYEKQGYSVYARGVGSVNRSVKHQHTHLIKLRNTRPKFVFFLRKPYFLLDR